MERGAESWIEHSKAEIEKPKMFKLNQHQRPRVLNCGGSSTPRMSADGLTWVYKMAIFQIIQK